MFKDIEAMKAALPFSLLVILALFPAPVPAEGPGPNPALTPEQVVRSVMQALGSNDEPYPNRGIEVTFSFASPANKAATGPVERFAVMVRGPIYGAMINHRRFKLENIQQDGDRALIDVVLTSSQGEQRGYRFVLSRQRGNPFDGSWMTDGVTPFEVVTL